MFICCLCLLLKQSMNFTNIPYDVQLSIYKNIKVYSELQKDLLFIS